VKYKTNQLTN